MSAWIKRRSHDPTSSEAPLGRYIELVLSAIAGEIANLWAWIRYSSRAPDDADDADDDDFFERQW